MIIHHIMLFLDQEVIYIVAIIVTKIVTTTVILVAHMNLHLNTLVIKKTFLLGNINFKFKK